MELAYALLKRLDSEGPAEVAEAYGEAVPVRLGVLSTIHLGETLEMIAMSDQVSLAGRREASDLLAYQRDLPSFLGRGGVVLIAFEFPSRHDWPAAFVSESDVVVDVSADVRYDCSWQRQDDDDDMDLYEESGLLPLSDAVAWARRRTEHILITPAWDPHATYVVMGQSPSDWRRRA